jgi:tetratricopeptide (TPR) repeat protein
MTTNADRQNWTRIAGLAVAALMLGASGAAADDTVLCQQSAANPDQGIPACTRLLSNPKFNKDTVLFNRARGHVARAALDSAIDDYTAAVNHNPKNIGALRNRGIIYVRKNEFDRALADFRQMILLDRNNAIGHSYHGFVLMEKGELDRAIGDFNTAIKLDGKNAEHFKHRARAFYRKHDLDRAVADYDQAAKLSPKDGSVFNDRAEIFIAKGEFDRAIADYDVTIRLDPENWRGYSSRGEAKRWKRDLDGALVDHNKAIELDPKSDDAFHNRALVWKDKGDLNRAIDDLNEAIVINPVASRSWGLRGELHRLKGDLGSSKANLDQAIKLFPSSAVLHCRRGDTLRELGTLDAALKDYNQAVLISATAICAYTGRGLVFEREGKLEAAKGELEKASRMDVGLDTDPVSGRGAQALAKVQVAAIDKAIAERKLADTKPNQRLAELEEQTRNLRELLESEKRRRAEAASKPAEPVIDMGRRIALVIGNAAYQNVGALANPKGDAEAIGAALTAVGFESVTVRHDLDRRKLLATLREFELQAEKADWAVIYYAGHGIEIGGVNYIIPVDAALSTDRDVGDEAVPLERVMLSLAQTKKLRLIVLDACRDNPFVSKMKRLFTREGGKGLADIEPDGGVIVAYAARGGQVAFDGQAGQRSPFVSALLKHIKTPRLDIGLMFRRVADDVMASTGRKQQPFIYGSPPGESLFFAAK